MSTQQVGRILTNIKKLVINQHMVNIFKQSSDIFKLTHETCLDLYNADPLNKIIISA